MKTILLSTAVAVLAFALVACSGGNGASNPNPNITGLDGQLTQGGAVKVTTAQGSGLSGINVALINQANGQVAGTATTDSSGKFSFHETPSGNFLLKLSFTSSADLDGDGLLDQIESFLPVTLTANQIAQLTAALDFADTDSDSVSDSLKIDVRFAGKAGGNALHFIRVLRHRAGQTQVDTNGDGTVDSSFDDEDNNGLPDDNTGGGSSQGPQGPKVQGTISAISGTSLTVNGQTFTINGATSFKVRGNSSSSSSNFTVGDLVQVTSFTDSSGNKIATEVKLKHGHANHSNDDTQTLDFSGTISAISNGSLTVSGQQFKIDDRTRFFLSSGQAGTQSQFATGGFVKVEALKLSDGGYVALHVTQAIDDNSGDTGNTLELTGVISAVSSTSVTINGITFNLSGDTQFKLSGGGSGSASDFAVGDLVKVEASQNAGQWNASELDQTSIGGGGGL